jgi:hypothetical protein
MPKRIESLRIDSQNRPNTTEFGIRKEASRPPDSCTKYGVVVGRIRESGFEDSNLFANFAGEREDSNPIAKDSNLCCQVKITQNCLK